MKAIGYSFGASLVTSLAVVLVAAIAFGFRLAEWTEWQGRVAGAAATAAGIFGAFLGAKRALRDNR
jgi:uncharacterized membrane protein YfcA